MTNIIITGKFEIKGIPMKNVRQPLEHLEIEILPVSPFRVSSFTSYKEEVLHPKAKEIIKLIHKQSGYMTINEISKETGFASNTVKKYLKELIEMNIIEEVPKKEENPKKTRGPLIRHCINYKTLEEEK